MPSGAPKQGQLTNCPYRTAATSASKTILAQEGSLAMTALLVFPEGKNLSGSKSTIG